MLNFSDRKRYLPTNKQYFNRLSMSFSEMEKEVITQVSAHQIAITDNSNSNIVDPPLSQPAETSKKRRDWEGVTGGNTLGQKALKILFSVVNVRVGYFFLLFVIPFYMLFRRKGYIAIYRYFREQHGYSPLKSLLKTYRNHFIFGQTLMDRFAVYAGQKNIFRVDNPNNDIFLAMLDDPSGCIIAGSHIGNPELCGYL